MDSGHTLVVLRHAKAAGEPGVNDTQRPLTGRGRRDAGAAGRWLLAQGIRPDLVLCSSARRTRETWEQVSAAMGAAAPGAAMVSFEDRSMTLAPRVCWTWSTSSRTTRGPYSRWGTTRPRRTWSPG